MGGAFHRPGRGCKAHLTPAREGAHASGRMPHRDRYLFVCTNRREEGNPKGSCAQKQSEEIIKALKGALLERGLGKSTRACSSSCLDLCEIGATILVEPDHVVYGNVTLADVDAIADAVAKGQIVERLVVPRPERSK
jgi:(2Fe-2S) ferredoxin